MNTYVHSFVCTRGQRRNYSSKPIVEEGEKKKTTFRLLNKQMNEMLIVDTHTFSKTRKGVIRNPGSREELNYMLIERRKTNTSSSEIQLEKRHQTKYENTYTYLKTLKRLHLSAQLSKQRQH